MTDQETRATIVAEVISHFQKNPILLAQKYITAEDAAKYMGMTYDSLATMRRLGNGPR